MVEIISFFDINDEHWEIEVIKSGILEGSVLGPILYTVYTSDILTIENAMLATYEDNTATFAAIDSVMNHQD